MVVKGFVLPLFFMMLMR